MPRSIVRRATATVLLLTVAVATCGCESPAGLRILAFHAPWCSQCHTDEPQLTEIKIAGYAVSRINADADADGRIDASIAGRFSVGALPTYIVLVGGHERWRGNSIDELVRFLNHQ